MLKDSQGTVKSLNGWCSASFPARSRSDMVNIFDQWFSKDLVYHKVGRTKNFRIIFVEIKVIIFITNAIRVSIFLRNYEKFIFFFYLENIICIILPMTTLWLLHAAVRGLFVNYSFENYKKNIYKWTYISLHQRKD